MTSVSCCRACKGYRQCQVVGKLMPHMLREGEESWTVSVWSTANLSPPGLLLGKVRTGYVRYMGWMDVLVRVFVYFSKTYRTRWKKQGYGNKRTANSTGRLHNDHHRPACTPHSTLHSSQESRSLHLFHRLPWDAVYVVSKAQVKKCIVVT